MKKIFITVLNIIFIPYFLFNIMLKKTAKLILSRELKDISENEKSLHDKNKNYYRQIEDLKETNKSLNNKLLRIEYLLNERVHKNSVITYEKTKKEIEVIVAVVEKDSLGNIEIEIFDIETDFYRANRKLILRCKKRENVFFIDDIEGGNGKGHGEIAMNKLFEIAKKENVNKIKGELVPKDFDQRDRQIAFYKKMGFEIKLDEDRENGSIEKKI